MAIVEFAKPGVEAKKANSETNEFWVKKKEFGSQSESSLRVKRLRALVLLFGVLILALAGSVFYMSQNFASLDRRLKAQQAQQKIEKTVIPAPKAAIKVLSAKSEIAEGARLSPQMLLVRELKEEELRSDMVRAVDTVNVIGKFTAQKITAGSVVSSKMFANIDPTNLTPFKIPLGFRAISISIDRRSSVEGFVRPGSRVDVLWFSKDRRGYDKVTRIIPAARVLSVGGMTQIEGHQGPDKPISSTVTLLVSAEDSKIIELARNLGSITLSLVGDDKESDLSTATQNAPVTVRDIMRRAQGVTEEDSYFDGMLRTKNPKTGKTQTFVLGRKGWREKDLAKRKNNKTATNNDTISEQGTTTPPAASSQIAVDINKATISDTARAKLGPPKLIRIRRK